MSQTTATPAPIASPLAPSAGPATPSAEPTVAAPPALAFKRVVVFESLRDAVGCTASA